MRSFITLHSSPNIRVIKSRMSWAGLVAWMGDMRNHTKFLSGKTKGRDHSENLGVNGRINTNMGIMEIGC
jgi:hypothetical protein